MEYGDGEKDGDQKQWQHKDQAEQVELLMDIAIDFILQLCILISCKNILILRFVNYLFKV